MPLRNSYKAATRTFVNWRIYVRAFRFSNRAAIIGPATLLCVFSLYWLSSSDVDNLYLQSLNSVGAQDACAAVEPTQMVHFDPPYRISSMYLNASDKDRAMAVSATVFTSLFKMYVFEPNTDVVLNISASDAARDIDVKAARPFMQSALRRFKNDDSIMLDKVSFGYTHMCRLRGLRYVFHITATSSKVSGSVAQSQHVIAFQRLLDGTCHVGIANLSEKEVQQPVYFVVPYAGRPNRLKWFLNQFDRLRGRNLNLRLVLAVGSNEDSGFHSAERLVNTMRFARDVRIVRTKGDADGHFSRAVAIRDAADYVPDDGLMFISDIDMQIFRPFFENCIMNTVQGHQVYFPVFYTLFPEGKHIDRRQGYWRLSSYGMSCMYKSDFAAVAAYKEAETEFSGWGEEDVHLMKAFSSHSDYEVFRATEPSLRHKWHVKRCQKNTPSYDSCLTMLYDQLGTGASLGKYLFLKQGIDAQKFLAGAADKDDSPEDVALRVKVGQDRVPVY